MKSEKIQEMVEQYREHRPRYETFTNRLHELFSRLLNESNIKVHLIEARTKSEQSFRYKISRPDRNYVNPLQDVTDLSAIRIIVYDEADVENVSELVAKEFCIDTGQSSDKLESLNPEEFGYRSVHLVVSLSSLRSSLPEWASWSSLKCELQIRSVFQHAWAVISHVLEYKREEEVPKELLRRLHRLSALVELADQELSSLYSGLRSHAERIDEDFSKGIPERPIDRNSLIKFLEKSPSLDRLIHVAKSYGVTVLRGEGGPVAENMIPELAWVCRQAGIGTTEELEKFVVQVVANHKRDLSALPRGHAMISTFFLCLVIVIARPERFIDLGPTYFNMWNGITEGFLGRVKRERAGATAGLPAVN